MGKRRGAQALSSRRERLLEEAVRRGADGYLLADPANLRYYTGFSGSNGQALIAPGSCRLFTDGRYELQAAREAPGCEVVVCREGLFEALGEAAREMGIRRLGYEPGAVSAAFVSEWRRKAGRGAPLRAAGGAAASPRAVKDVGEVELLRRAARLSEAALTEVLGMLKDAPPGAWSESSFAGELEAEMRRRGADDRSFPTIALSGTRSALPHGKPSSRRLRGGGLLLVDWGAVLDGYHADLSRTVLPERPRGGLRRAADAVLRARERVLRELRPGVRAADMDRLARSVLEEAGLGRFIAHSLGHGVGLEVHEAPHLSVNSDERLEAGMVFTIEPGLYLPRVGGVRVEDMFLLTHDGPQPLSSVSDTIITNYHKPAVS